MKFLDAVHDYSLFLMHEQNVTPGTLETYKSWLRHFSRWLEENGYPDADLDCFNLHVLRRFLYTLSGRGYRPRTIRGVFHPLRGLGEFLVKHGALTENPARKVVMPKLDAANRKTVSDLDIAALFAACERMRTRRQIAFCRALLATFAYAGLRRSEACDLKVEDIDLPTGSVLVRQGKGRKSRRVYVCEDCVNAWREWLAVREKDCALDYLFMFDRRRRIHDDGLRTLLQTLKASAGLRDHEGVCFHSLRHAAATRLLRNGANLKDIQTFLGHSCLGVTSVYLHSNEEQARSIAELTALRPEPPLTKEEKPLRLPQREEQRERLRRRIAR